MAITLTKVPPLIALAGNGIPVTAREDSISSTIGVSLDDADAYTNVAWEIGDYFTIKTGYLNETFTCVNTVSNPENEFAYNSSGDTFDVWSLRIINALRLNTNIISNYKLTWRTGMLFGYPGLEFFLDAYEKTKANSITFESNRGDQERDGILIKIPFTTSGGAYDEDVYNKNHRVIFELFREYQVSTDFTELQKIGSSIAIPLILKSNYGYADFDLKRIIKSDVTGHFSFPEKPNFHIRQSTIISKYNFFAYSDYNYTPSRNSGAFSDTFYILQGKISEQLYRQFNTDNTSFYNKLVSSKMFLSFAPLEKETDIYTPEKLYFLFRSAVTARLMVREYDLEGAGTECQLEEFSPGAYEVYELQTSFLKVRQERTSPIAKYEIWLQDSVGTLLSEIRTYVLNYNYYQYARYLLFRTRLGAYETVRLTGKATKSLETEKTYMQLSEKAGRTFKDRTEKQIDSSQDLYITINSGYFPDEWREYLAGELAESNDVYWLKNGIAYAVNVENSRLVIQDDNEDLVGFELTLRASDLSDEFHEVFDIEIPVEGDFSELDFQEDYYNIE